MCCPCFNDFTNYIKSFFVKNEDQIKIEIYHLANGIIPIIPSINYNNTLFMTLSTGI